MKKNLETEEDTRWRTKGHTHKVYTKEDYMKICPFCDGLGTFEISSSREEICEYCDGQGVIYD